MSGESDIPSEPRQSVSPWRLTGWIAFAVTVGSLVACLVMAVSRSEGLTEIKVTALDADAEPRDHKIPLFKKKEALPDYQLIVMQTDRQKLNLGTKPDQSAVDGLSWKLSEPVSVADIATIRLQDQDKVISDVLEEVHITGSSVSTENYRFDFETERSFSVGVRSFFQTPLGKTVVSAFFLAVFLIVVSLFAV